MTDYMTMEKIWQGDGFFELEVLCSSKIISATTRVYATNAGIRGLSETIMKFLSGNPSRSIWENGEKGDRTTAYMSMEFFRKDKLGHVQIEVYMELDDGGKFSKHNCCYYIESELGMLEVFAKALIQMLDPTTGQKAVLNHVE